MASFTVTPKAILPKQLRYPHTLQMVTSIISAPNPFLSFRDFKILMNIAPSSSWSVLLSFPSLNYRENTSRIYDQMGTNARISAAHPWFPMTNIPEINGFSARALLEKSHPSVSEHLNTRKLEFVGLYETLSNFHFICSNPSPTIIGFFMETKISTYSICQLESPSFSFPYASVHSISLLTYPTGKNQTW